MKRLAGVFMLLPGAAFACALPPSVILTLPTGHYITGAAITVALTGVMGAISARLPSMDAQVVFDGPERLSRMVPAYASLMAFLAIVIAGILGPDDPMHNLLTLVFWTGVWIALPLASMVLGNLWWGLTPFYAPVRIIRGLIGRTGSVGLSRFLE